MTEHDVVIAGGGPTGMMLAAELALAGVDAVVVERRRDQSVDGSRAGGLHARTMEVLDQRGVVDRFLSAGQTYPSIGYAQMMLPIDDFPTRFACTLGLWQSQFEPILADRVAELGVTTMRGLEVVGLAQDAGLALRKTDVMARWGGEEFLLLLPQTATEFAKIPLQRLAQLLAEHDWQGVLPATERVTVSIGLAESDPDETLDELIGRADAALYEAKAGGRNRTETAPGV